MATVSDFQRASYTGTIVGVVIALCAVCKYLFSDNVATLLDYWTDNLSWQGYTNIVNAALQLISIFVIYGPIRKELKDSDILQKVGAKCCCKKQSKEELEDYFDKDEFNVHNNVYLRQTSTDSYPAEARTKSR